MVHSKLDGIRGDTAIGWGVGGGGGILGNLKSKLLNNFHKFSFSRWGVGGGWGVEGGVVYSW